ncbi:MAG: putative periplasmic solute-binding protein [Candidatus Woesebacteria bacterium GW2011_GWA1_39_8]|uniref:Putative periplasmic solute-binding protein n=1 Tax=Candidatus Woesebacteria bacterium GW2011_GWA1_39_8 TaxID=1618552 RepID=A0A0G0PYW7_9BACT|nr:MAG: putative periplasmic solute-binding protein [Candidatus Woesebacteria bacterium GW2011_GWA1_39_8]
MYCYERPVVAGILFNRLDIGMGLQVDATVQYAAATIKCKSNSECNWWPILTRENLLIYSPYNTYKYRGLPPAPIANPGLYSLKAVINSEDTEYLYYLHDSEGNIHYAKSLDEHNENVRKYLGK